MTSKDRVKERVETVQNPDKPLEFDLDTVIRMQRMHIIESYYKRKPRLRRR